MSTPTPPEGYPCECELHRPGRIFYCSLEFAHTGEHIAREGDMEVARWEQDATRSSPADSGQAEADYHVHLASRTETPASGEDGQASIETFERNYLVSYGGGQGPDVWDAEQEVSGVDIFDALAQARRFTEEGGWVFRIEQNDYPPTSREKLEAALLASQSALAQIERERDTLRRKVFPEDKISAALNWIHENYNGDLAAFFDDVKKRRPVKEMENWKEMHEANKKHVKKCNHPPELVIGCPESKTGLICCECWALQEQSRATAAESELAALKAKVENKRFLIPDGFIETYHPFFGELPACEIIKEGILVSKDALMDVMNRLKNGMTEGFNKAIAERDSLQSSLTAAQAREEELKAEVERLKSDDGGLVDEFIHRLFNHITQLGVDVSSCDGEDDPALVIAHFFAGRIQDAESELSSLRALRKLAKLVIAPKMGRPFWTCDKPCSEKRMCPSCAAKALDAALSAQADTEPSRHLAGRIETPPEATGEQASTELASVVMSAEAEGQVHVRITCGKGQSFEEVHRGLRLMLAELTEQIDRRSKCPGDAGKHRGQGSGVMNQSIEADNDRRQLSDMLKSAEAKLSKYSMALMDAREALVSAEKWIEPDSMQLVVTTAIATIDLALTPDNLHHPRAMTAPRS